MMYYYSVALPVSVDKLYTYASTEDIKAGCRVIVTFNNRITPALVWAQIDKPEETEKKIKYLTVIELIDTEPVISDEGIRIAEWMSKYYHAPPGMSLFSMIPSGLQVTYKRKVKLNSTDITEFADENEKKIFAVLKETQPLNLNDLKDKTGVSNIISVVEDLEERNLVEIENISEKKVKDKFRNYVRVVETNEDSLPRKQKELLKLLMNSGKTETAVSSLAQDFSYSVIKGLRDKGKIDVFSKKVRIENDIWGGIRNYSVVNLTESQNSIFQSVKERINCNQFKTFLLYGITGSGKTDIYAHCVKEVIDKGKSAIVLLPEISLTPQFIGRFHAYFGDQIAVIHSALTMRERVIEWKKIRSGKARIVIGARSALFAPIVDLGIIIVDEEHENTYKQENTPRYNARDLSVLLAKIKNAVCILGSATPSLESWKNSSDGKYELLKLTKRPFETKMPELVVLDLKNTDDEILSKDLRDEIENTINAGKQVLLFQNRRGYANFVQCSQCGHIIKCSECDVSMKYHKHDESIQCHYCGKNEKAPDVCPECESRLLKYGSAGIQQVESRVRAYFPEARIMRIDSDTVTTRKSYESFIQRMEDSNIDILIGTQMVAKGLHFPNLSLLGVINVDSLTNIPDFRAEEKAFQMLTQVAGRVGRGDHQGKVLLQTYNPDSFIIQMIKKHDFVSFIEHEMSNRGALFYPPYSKLVRILFSCEVNDLLIQETEKIDKFIIGYRRKFRDSGLEFLGPVQAPITKLHNRYRYHLLVKSRTVSQISLFLNFFKENLKLHSAVRVNIDVDPANLI